MSFVFETTLTDATAAAARDLFDRIVRAEEGRLSEEQRNNPRAYLLDAWQKACEAVMHPTLRLDDLQRQVEDLQDKLSAATNPYHSSRI